MMGEHIGQKSILRLYFALGVCLFLLGLGLVISPMIGSMILTFLFFVGVLIAAYRIRRKSDSDLFKINHTTFIICTIWVGWLIGFLCCLFSGLISYIMSGFLKCFWDFSSSGQVMEAHIATDEDGVLESFPCYDLLESSHVLITAEIIGSVPLLVYYIYRLYKGIKYAAIGQTLEKPKAWF